MAETKSNKIAVDHQNRRRALLAALVGAGIPLSERIISGKWVTPVVDAVVLPAHAKASQEPELVFPLRFGAPQVVGSNDNNRAFFADIAHRSEEEILNMFISAAEANTCDAAVSCATDGAVTVEVFATIDGSPSNTACVKARVTHDEGSSCTPTKCEFFDFEATVSGQTVTVVNDCNLKLTNMSFDQTEFNVDWSYAGGAITEKTGSLTVALNQSGGCEALTGQCPADEP